MSRRLLFDSLYRLGRPPALTSPPPQSPRRAAVLRAFPVPASSRNKPLYVSELTALLKAGTPLMMWQGIRLKSGEIPEAFGSTFVVEGTKPKKFDINRAFLRKTIPGHWYWLRRR